MTTDFRASGSGPSRMEPRMSKRSTLILVFVQLTLW